MKLRKQEVQLLGLKEIETKVINTLEAQPEGLSVQQLAKKLGAPRTSLNWTLGQLLQRGLIRKETTGRTNMWYSNLAETVLRQSSDHVALNAFKIFHGLPSIRTQYQNILKLGSGERVVIVEGKKAVLTIAEKAGIDFMTQWHDTALERKMIMESIISNDTLKKLHAGLIAKEVATSLRRFTLWTGYAVPSELLTTNASLIVFRDTLLLVDWDTEQGVTLQNREIVTTVRFMLEAYRHIAEPVSLVQLLRSVN